MTWVAQQFDCRGTKSNCPVGNRSCRDHRESKPPFGWFISDEMQTHSQAWSLVLPVCLWMCFHGLVILLQSSQLESAGKNRNYALTQIMINIYKASTLGLSFFPGLLASIVDGENIPQRISSSFTDLEKVKLRNIAEASGSLGIHHLLAPHALLSTSRDMGRVPALHQPAVSIFLQSCPVRGSRPRCLIHRTVQMLRTKAQ